MDVLFDNVNVKRMPQALSGDHLAKEATAPGDTSVDGFAAGSDRNITTSMILEEP